LFPFNRVRRMDAGSKLAGLGTSAELGDMFAG
jgi:hypothetical protein